MNLEDNALRVELDDRSSAEVLIVPEEPLTFTNTGMSVCMLRGFPGVSSVGENDGPPRRPRGSAPW